MERLLLTTVSHFGLLFWLGKATLTTVSHCLGFARRGSARGWAWHPLAPSSKKGPGPPNAKNIKKVTFLKKQLVLEKSGSKKQNSSHAEFKV